MWNDNAVVYDDDGTGIFELLTRSDGQEIDRRIAAREYFPLDVLVEFRDRFGRASLNCDSLAHIDRRLAGQDVKPKGRPRKTFLLRHADLQTSSRWYHAFAKALRARCYNKMIDDFEDSFEEWEVDDAKAILENLGDLKEAPNEAATIIVRDRFFSKGENLCEGTVRKLISEFDRGRAFRDTHRLRF